MRRFLITCHARTGASLLVDALAQNPKVAAFGEVFMPDAALREKDGSVFGRAYRDGEDGVSFLRDWLYLDRGQGAVGFKLMYYDGREGPLRAARAYLEEQSDIAVVHLWRQDYLARLASDLIAEKVGVWSVPIDAAPGTTPTATITIPLERAQGEFEWLDEMVREPKIAFARHPYLEVLYERDLQGDASFEATLARLWDFLGVPKAPAQKRLRKQATRRLRDQVANFDELARHFAGTPYARFFSG